MMMHAKGIAETKKWDEKPYDEFEGGRKLTRASVTQSFTGGIEGEGAVEYLMAYPNENSASYVGLQKVTGRLGGRAGSFVLQLSGSYDGEMARATWLVVVGSGTGELQGLRGEGDFRAPHGSQASYTLDYEFES
ncbi:MAG: DUF3224 domain-containing protein [Caldilineaceae bacterium]|nr:DUF3224 domain-containing protein [Caldilineaceae bacterium]